jgi:hypothetical protein
LTSALKWLIVRGTIRLLEEIPGPSVGAGFHGLNNDYDFNIRFWQSRG